MFAAQIAMLEALAETYDDAGDTVAASIHMDAAQKLKQRVAAIEAKVMGDSGN